MVSLGIIDCLAGSSSGYPGALLLQLSTLSHVGIAQIMSAEKVEHELEEHHALPDDDTVSIPPTGCGIMGRYPVLSVLLFAGAGIGLGVGLSFWEPDGDQKDLTLKWIGLVGVLFIRALKAIVLPLVFINVVLSVMDMMTVGKAGSIGWKTIATYLFTTVMAATIGIIWVVIFRPLFSSSNFADPSDPTVTLGCNAEGSFLAEFPDGSVSCTSNLDEADNEFLITDVGGTFVMKSSGARDDISLSDTIYDGVFTKLLTDNIFKSFVEANFAAVVFFAIFFGVALSRVLDQRRQVENSFVICLFKELDGVFIMIINCKYRRLERRLAVRLEFSPTFHRGYHDHAVCRFLPHCPSYRLSG